MGRLQAVSEEISESRTRDRSIGDSLIRELSEALFDEFDFMVDADGKTLFLWDGKRYRALGQRGGDTYCELMALVGDAEDVVFQVPHYRWSSVVKSIADQARESGRTVLGYGSGVWDGVPHAVFDNGIVNLRTGELSPSTPDCTILEGFRSDYSPGMPTPVYDQWIVDRGLSDQQEELEAMTAGMFDSTFRDPRAMMLTGTWQSGKTTWGYLARGMCLGDGALHNRMCSRYDLFELHNTFGGMAALSQRVKTLRNAHPSVAFASGAWIEGRGALTNEKVSRLLNTFPTNALLMIEVDGDGGYLRRKWESAVDPSVLAVFQFPHRIEEKDRDRDGETRKLLHAERGGIATKWIASRIRDGLVA